MSALVDTIRNLASTYPHAIYPSQTGCFYTQGQPTNGPEREGCLIGQAIITAYPDLSNELRSIDSMGTIGAEDVLSDYLKLTEDMEPEEVDWVCQVQGYQDDGETWAGAVEAADEDAGNKGLI